PVALPPGRARLATKPLPTGSATIAKTIGMMRVSCNRAAVVGVLCERIRSGCNATSSLANRCIESGSAGIPQRVSIRKLRPSTQPNLRSFHKRCELRLGFQITHQHADPPHPLGLLRARRERPRRCRAAEQRDELAALHSITSSARASRIGKTSKPKALAALRLITNSNLVPCWTGKSAGFTPLRILSTKLAERYHVSLRLTE